MSSKISVQDSDEVASYAAPYHAINKKEDYSATVLLPFEDAEFYAPVGYDAILKNNYGNYMELPPEEKRVPHHICGIYWK